MTVRPFEITVPDAVLDRISRQVADARIGYAPMDDDGSWSYGTDAAYLAELVAYWREHYDWRAQERALNCWPHFKAEIDGIDIHFQHIRGSGGGRPLVLTHGWPGSIVEFQGVIEQLAFPERFGGRAEDGFDLVIPSLPGFGWSGRPPKPIGPKG
ncbi:epoxide hydrolase, partial [uncultured Sphingomonas sp.]|uniref:epoxide hydrolase family protein n=1 Tax=uncultured Sphingomonas sp. TaxID=158754 RepID=UPI0025F30E3F